MIHDTFPLWSIYYNNHLSNINHGQKTIPNSNPNNRLVLKFQLPP